MEQSNSLSVIVPVRNEKPSTLAKLANLVQLNGVTELIVVDSSDQRATIDELNELQARLPSVTVIRSDRPGRAYQMNQGEAVATGNVIWFIHADTSVPSGAAECILKSISSEQSWGRFDVRFDCPSMRMKLVAFGMNVRSAWSGVCTGDQAIFVSRTLFEKLGGFPEVPIMEDVLLTKRMKREAQAIRIRVPVTTSARRWKTHGYLKTVLQMWLMRFLSGIGVSPQFLAKLYD